MPEDHNVFPLNKRDEDCTHADMQAAEFNRFLANVCRDTPRNEKEVWQRFVWVATLNAFWDVLQAKELKASALNNTYQWMVAKRFATAQEEAKKNMPTVSQGFLDTEFTVKVDAVDYLPGQRQKVFAEHGKLYLNTWEPGPLEPIKGDITPWWNLLCWLLPDEEERGHLIRWLAFLVRHQGVKINHGPLIGGATRIGKDTIIQPVLRYLGEDNCEQIGAEQLGDIYQDFAVNKKLVVIEEIIGAGTGHRQVENKLKILQASPPDRVSLRRHSKPAVTVRNLMQLVMFSNARKAISATTGKDRVLALWCTPDAPREKQYYIDFYRWLDGGGDAYVVHWLLHEVNLDGFAHKAPAPSTAWRDELELTSRTDVEALIAELVEDRELPFEGDTVKLDNVVQYLIVHHGRTIRGGITRHTVQEAFNDLGFVNSGNKKQRGFNGKDYPVLIRMWAVRDPKSWEDRSAQEWVNAWKKAPVPDSR